MDDHKHSYSLAVENKNFSLKKQKIGKKRTIENNSRSAEIGIISITEKK